MHSAYPQRRLSPTGGMTTRASPSPARRWRPYLDAERADHPSPLARHTTHSGSRQPPAAQQQQQQQHLSNWLNDGLPSNLNHLCRKTWQRFCCGPAHMWRCSYRAGIHATGRHCSKSSLTNDVSRATRRTPRSSLPGTCGRGRRRCRAGMRCRRTTGGRPAAGAAGCRPPRSGRRRSRCTFELCVPTAALTARRRRRRQGAHRS